jgi:endonuclease/exonuclease/phosphatase family metal-dependent hydrolase
VRRLIVLAVSLALGIGLAVVLALSTDLGPFGESAERVPVKAMTFNVFYGGDDYDLAERDWCAESNGCTETLDQVVVAITASGADVVGLEEGEDNTQVIADKLGWHASPRTQVISRFPIIDPPGADGAYVYVEVEPGRVVAFSSVHLPAEPYGPYEIRDGATAAEVEALERKTRGPMLQERLRALEPLVADDTPVILVGDFNSPSNLDWTEAADAARDEVRYPVSWPVGELTEAAGFRDTYREAHPDPVATPGFTWTPGGPEGDPKEVHDRIDWVLVAGPAETEASRILGEDGGPDVDVEAGDPFPSDHRGVVSTLTVEPVDTPVLVAVSDRNVTVGDDVTATFSAPGEEGESIVLVRAGTSGERADPQQTNGAEHGTVTLSTDGLQPGDWEALLIGADGEELSRSPFWLYEEGAQPSIETREGAYRPGEAVTFAWRAAAGNRWDWIGLYKASDADVPTDGGIAGDADDYLLYEYTGTAIEGTGRFTARSQAGSGKWPLPPGRYELRLLVDDGYESIARSRPFTVGG